MNRIILGSAAIALSLANAGRADITHDDDVIIGLGKTATDSLCVGSDCIDGESFASENIKIKEESPNILFEDTDTDAADWMIAINNGGPDAFQILDLESATGPFTVQGGAPTDAMYIESSTGDLGLGTSLPQKEIHVVDSAFPALRLEQDNTSGFPQIWDLYASNTAMGFQDISNGLLPFSVVPGAPTASLYVNALGLVGMGTNVPESTLHVKRIDGSARIFVEEASGTQAVREMFLMKNNGGSYFTMKNTQSGRDWYFTHENAAGGRFIITASTNPSKGLFLSDSGNLQIGGVLTENSDKNAKMAIEPVDTAEILDKVAALDISAWTYKDDAEAARHVGPMAQDFHALFGLGATETGISTLDTSGVALAAIKALDNRDTALAEQNAALAKRNAGLEARNAAQDRLIEDMLARIAALEAAR